MAPSFLSPTNTGSSTRTTKTSRTSRSIRSIASAASVASLGSLSSSISASLSHARHVTAATWSACTQRTRHVDEDDPFGDQHAYSQPPTRSRLSRLLRVGRRPVQYRRQYESLLSDEERRSRWAVETEEEGVDVLADRLHEYSRQRQRQVHASQSFQTSQQSQHIQHIQHIQHSQHSQHQGAQATALSVTPRSSTASEWFDDDEEDEDAWWMEV